jgi:hypothetical protein
VICSGLDGSRVLPSWPDCPPGFLSDAFALTRERPTLLTRQRRITRRRQRAVRRIALKQPLMLIAALTQPSDLRQETEHQLARRPAPANAIRSASARRVTNIPRRNPPAHVDPT